MNTAQQKARSFWSGLFVICRYLSLLSEIAIEEGYYLSPCATQIGRERGGAGALGNAFASRPQHGVRIERAGLNVGEGIAAALSQHTSRSPQEGHGLGAGNRGCGAEGRIRGALGYALLNSPQHSLVIVVVCAHIRKRIVRGSRLG